MQLFHIVDRHGVCTRPVNVSRNVVSNDHACERRMAIRGSETKGGGGWKVTHDPE